MFFRKCLSTLGYVTPDGVPDILSRINIYTSLERLILSKHMHGFPRGWVGKGMPTPDVFAPSPPKKNMSMRPTRTHPSEKVYTIFASFLRFSPKICPPSMREEKGGAGDFYA